MLTIYHIHQISNYGTASNAIAIFHAISTPVTCLPLSDAFTLDTVSLYYNSLDTSKGFPRLHSRKTQL